MQGKIFMVYCARTLILFSEDQEKEAKASYESACRAVRKQGLDPELTVCGGEIIAGHLDDLVREATADGVTVHRCDQGEPFPWTTPEFKQQVDRMSPMEIFRALL